MRIGVAGLGFGQNLLHTLLLRSDCTVVACADHFPARLDFARSRGIACYDDAAQMIRDADLDAVVLASAPHVRGDGLAAALERDIPVFMEKPIAGETAMARSVVEQCRGHAVMMGFSFRFHAPVQKLISLANGPAGGPVLINADYQFDWLPPSESWLWRSDGGGFFNENSCHLFDVVLALMGEPETVYAVGFDDGIRPSPTAASVVLGYAGGRSAALTLGGRADPAFRDYPRCDVVFASGQARMSGRNHMWTRLRWSTTQSAITEMTHEPEALGRTRYSDAFDHFFACIRDGSRFDATPEDGLGTVRLAEAVYRSIESGQAAPF